MFAYYFYKNSDLKVKNENWLLLQVHGRKKYSNKTAQKISIFGSHFGFSTRGSLFFHPKTIKSENLTIQTKKNNFPFNDGAHCHEKRRRHENLRKRHHFEVAFMWEFTLQRWFFAGHQLVSRTQFFFRCRCLCFPELIMQ